MHHTFFRLLTRVFVPFGAGALGVAVFISARGFASLTTGEAIGLATNGLFLFGSAAAIAAWRFESRLEASIRAQVMRELDWLTGVESLPDEERAAIVMAYRYLQLLTPKDEK